VEVGVQRELDAYFDRAKYPVIDMSVPFKLALGAAFLVAVGIILAFSRLRLGRLERGEAKWAYLFLSPWIFGFVVLTLGPMLASFFFSFTQWDVLNEARWVGTKNYADTFGSDWATAAKAFGNAVYLAAVGVPLSLFTGLGVALLLNAAARGMRFYRTAFYLPAIVPGIAAAVLWTWIFTADPSKGLINGYWSTTISAWFNTEVPGWLGSAEWSRPALIFMGAWGAGSGMLLWLAGLKGVSSTLYEASSLDGANGTQQFWSVTFPQLSPIVFFNTVMGFIGSMQEFDRQYVIANKGQGSVGPDDTLLTPVYRLFNDGFTYFRMGPASAFAWLIFAVILILTFSQFKLAPRWVHYETDK
ncbi:sugar ABC transporter permease, partial [bacterium]